MRSRAALFRAALLAGGAATAWSPTAHAWSADAHRAIAMIAQRRLEPGTAAQLRELLGPRLDLPSLAACPDDIRVYWDDRKDGRPASLPPTCAAVFPVAPQGTDRWHYVDIDAALANPTATDMHRSCRGPNKTDCVLRQIPIHAGVLGDPRGSKARRAQAAVFLVHLVADVHQPLHCAERNDDGGGGQVRVLFPGRARQQNLHGVWDAQIPRRIAGTPAQIVTKLDGEILDAAQERAKTDLQAAVLKWARESHAAARGSAYAGVAPPPTVTKLDERYVAAARDVAARRIALAGVRLATLLNDLLD
jgi:hypothetical protein